MINETTFLTSTNYVLSFIEKHVIKKDKNDNILVFGAVYHISDGSGFSKGVVEMNQTLWNPESSKRPKGYLIINHFELAGNRAGTLFVERDWYYSIGHKMKERIEQECLLKMNKKGTTI
ncbi:hypothetical protein [Metabacillus niabensis]|uniref:hypothetical protein n=1 Tax=Metabacillus niabensis TaxID=324854 RepID=UPI0011A4B325